ncbi:16167_t:CDS:2 [Cetraspora pellucida]|uniref:16167_t:CDS:1 n=1 Tax=Cetraspora pellucida TaxID=1433469 RepID=A0ACA9M243_9GLOM|nr:16167_t:CDS:2 [Cetraspora pellucida]
MHTKQNIHFEWELKIPALKRVLLEALGVPYTFVVNFVDVFIKINDSDSQYKSYYTAELGSRAFRYFNELVRNIENLGAWVRQKIVELTKSRKIYLVATATQSWRDESIKIEDDALWIHCDQSYFGGYISVAYDIVNIIEDIINPSPHVRKILKGEQDRNNVCRECGEFFSSHLQWCRHCNSQHFKEQFGNWTSTNCVVDNFLKDTQINACDASNSLEWIDYSRFKNVTNIGGGANGTIYKAYFLDGDIRRWDNKKHCWERYPGFSVALKVLHNSKKITVEFMNELKAMHKCTAGKLTNIVAIYGITQNPYTKEFMMVMEYMNRGNMRDYLRNNTNLNWSRRLKIVLEIATGLMNIHTNGLIHGDFHSANLFLEDTSGDTAFIGDLGLCHLSSVVADEIFGAMPYMAPEVLRSKLYTKAADIYSFGMLMWEVATGNPPFYDRAHDLVLFLDILEGHRPPLLNEIPDCYKNLMKRCWDPEPYKRPSAEEIRNFVENWYCDKSQFNFSDADNKEIKNREPHPSAIYARESVSEYITRYLISSKQLEFSICEKL